MTFPYKTIEDIDCKGMRVLVRADLNVPLKDGVITDDKRIRASLPTIKHLMEKGAKVIVLSHLGRPKGEVKKELSLRPVSERLSKLLGVEVRFTDDCVGKLAADVIKKLNNGEVVLLENTRFHPGEKTNDPEFAKEIACLGDIFVNDAFGTAHRAHASNVGLAEQLDGAYAGFLMESEVEELTKILNEPQHPFVVIIGGAKIKTKLGVVENMLKVADVILIGGGVSYTLLKAGGVGIGKSLLSEEFLPNVKKLLAESGEPGKKIFLSIDRICMKDFDENAEVIYIDKPSIPEDLFGIDIGKKTIDLFKKKIDGAKTIIWNGPLGVFEWKNGERGTREIATAIANSNAYTLIGGGETVSAIEKFGLLDRYDHISTGGGAMLEFLKGVELPGIKVLLRR